MKYEKCCRNCEYYLVPECKGCNTFGDNTWENFKLRKEFKQIENGTLISKWKVKSFVDKFTDFLISEMEDAQYWLDHAETKAEAERMSDSLSQLDFVFQIFGRLVEKRLGIKFFDEEKSHDKQRTASKS